MDPIDSLLDRLYADGCDNDSKADGRQAMRFNITPSTGRFLDALVGDAQPKRILEVGTSNGYSTIWLARAARRIGAAMDSVDCDQAKHSAAVKHLGEAGLMDQVTLHTTDAGDFLAACNAETYDFVFLDSDRASYVEWALSLLRATKFGTMVVDNAISHESEMTEFCRLVRSYGRLGMLALPIGKGQLVIREASATY